MSTGVHRRALPGFSHRWVCKAAVAPKKTTRENLKEHLENTPIGQLTPAMQDAIAIAHQLNIRYLWIDSLCIVQDDLDDWVAESAKMSTIYSQSTLIIFATSIEGCFLPRAGFQERHYHYDVQSNNETVELVAQTPLQHSHVDRNFREVPAHNLFKRGWAFQEWLLNSRAIVFGAAELLWC